MNFSKKKNFMTSMARADAGDHVGVFPVLQFKLKENMNSIRKQFRIKNIIISAPHKENKIQGHIHPVKSKKKLST